MSLILDIRGTHGSGKSYVVHQLLSKSTQHTVLNSDLEIIGTYLPDARTVILGKYLNNCGGCDQIKTQNDICDRVRTFADLPEVDVVVLEGILVAHTFTRYNNLAIEMENKGHTYEFLFLDVDLDTCIRRVRARRVERGQDPDFDCGPRSHIAVDHRLVHGRVKQRLIDAGRTVVTIEAGDGADPALEFEKYVYGER